MISRHHVLLFGFVTSLAVAVPAPARADDTRSIDAAKKSFDLGMEQYRNNDLEGARISLAQSYAAWPSVETLRALAIAELNTEHVLDALKHFKLYAKDKNADQEFVKTKLPGFVERCNQRVAHVRVLAPLGSIVILDGHRVTDLNESVDVLPGAHTITLRGVRADTRSVTVSATQSAEINFNVEDAAVVQPTPAVSSETPQPARAEPEPSSFWTARGAWTLGLGSAAIVAAGIGVGFQVAAGNDRSSYDSLVAGTNASLCGRPAAGAPCDQIRSAADSQRTAAHGSSVAFVTAGVFAAATAVVWFAWPKSATRGNAGWWLAPAVGRNAGISAGGNF